MTFNNKGLKMRAEDEGRNKNKKDEAKKIY